MFPSLKCSVIIYCFGRNMRFFIYILSFTKLPYAHEFVTTSGYSFNEKPLEFVITAFFIT